MPKNVPVPGPAANKSGGSVSVSVRKIENGYVTRKTEVTERGDYSESETFTEARPSVAVDVTAAAMPSSNTLRRAVDSLKS